MSTPRPIHRATAADAPALAEALARAFADDPIVTWAFPELRVRTRRLPRFFAWSLRKHVPQGASWTTPASNAAALWAEPGQWKETPWEAIRLVASLGPSVGRRSARVVRGLTDIEGCHPDGRHLYLAVLGVDTPLQGTGIGSALLGPGLQRCDEEGLPAYLETAKERNVAFYERHGFVVRDHFTLPKGPPVWTMWRDPSSDTPPLRAAPR